MNKGVGPECPLPDDFFVGFEQRKLLFNSTEVNGGLEPRSAIIDRVPQVDTLEVMWSTINSFGIRGLYVGTTARLYYVTTLVLVQLSAYDAVKRFCGIIPLHPGSH